jgi:molybdate transport system substrate-binding protein
MAPDLLSTWAILAGLRLAAGADTLTVFAAADLQPAFREIAPAFERATGAQVILVFGSSGSLAVQIERGAPADLFFSADQSYITSLAAKRVLHPGSERVYALGHLVAATRRRSPVRLRQLSDLTRADIVRIAIANPDYAPYGRAAREALLSAGLWDALEPKLVIAENIRQAAQYLETGAVEAAILSRSVAADPALVTAEVEPTRYRPIVQAAGIVAGTARLQLTRRFLDFVTGETGWAIMKRYGFTRPVNR